MKSRKLRQPGAGKPKPPLTRLKELSLAERDKLMVVLRSKTYAEASPLFENLVGFACSESVLSKFFAWQSTQDSLENANNLVATFEDFARKQNPGWSPDKVRETAISFFLAHTAQTKDVDAFVNVAHLDLSERTAKTKAQFEEQKIQIAKRKLELLEKKAAQAERAKGVMEDEKLSEEQRAARMREIFGMS